MTIRQLSAGDATVLEEFLQQWRGYGVFASLMPVLIPA